MDISRIITVYVVQLGLGLAFAIIGAVILKRKRSRLNITISLFYLSIALAVLINVIYAPIENENIVKPLNFITFFFFCLPYIFLVVFNLLIWKSEKVIGLKYQIGLPVLFGILLLGGLFFYSGNMVNETTNWRPVWGIGYSIYNLAIVIIAGYIPAVYTSLEAGKSFKNPEMKKRWNFTIYANLVYFIGILGTTLANLIDNSTFRLVWSIISLLIFITVSYAIYYGIGKQISS